jgi:hypothetical protein
LRWRFAEGTAAVAAAAAVGTQAPARAQGRDQVEARGQVEARDRAAARGHKLHDRRALLDRRQIALTWLLARAAGAGRGRQTSAAHPEQTDPTLLRTGRRVV